MRTRSSRALALAVLLVVTAASVPVGSAGGSSPPADDGIDHQVNYTVTDGPGDGNNAPGATNQSTYLYQSAYGHDFEVVDYITFVAPAGQENTCTTTDARAAGVDRDDDDSGTTTDVTLIGKYKEQINYSNSAGQGITSFDFYEKGSFAGDPVSIYAPDQGILALEDCFTNPQTLGWYRGYFYMNGTNADGTRIQVAGFSSWSYVCACSSYDEAVDTIGPPPAEGPEGETMPDRDEGPWYLEAHRESDDGSGGQATPTPSAGTPTASATATPAGTTAPGTATPADESATAEPTETPTATADETATAEPTETPTATAEPTDAGDETATAEGSSGSGPGFSAVTAVTALLAAALVALRRD